MLNLRGAQRITIVGGGTAGWFAALTLRSMFTAQVEVMVIESPDIGIIGVGEGGILNLVESLNTLGIPLDEFMQETGAAYKLGFAYERWRTGQEDDCYYHMFYNNQVDALKWFDFGFFPAVSEMIRQGVPLEKMLKGFYTIEQQASQKEARKMLEDPSMGILGSFHFDSHRVAKYLAKVAVSRGVVHKRTKVVDFLETAPHAITHVVTTEEQIPTQFVIDASGLSRLIMGKRYQTQWISFKEYLLLDRAIPFHMPHPKAEPYLVTRAIAMRAGWMWQIPLVERVGAGYVFSSQHIDEEHAMQEIEQVVGHAITPMKTLRFEPGHFAQVWQGNVMAIGLASGFVEPLEATSIGQMLEQLRNFRRVVMEGNAVVSDYAINEFNRSNCAYWAGIRDFLRLHYDCPRRDTPFWQDVAQLPFPETYAAIKECLTQRTPRVSDIQYYAQNGWKLMFGIISWMAIAAPLGLIHRDRLHIELEGLPPDAKQKLGDIINRL